MDEARAREIRERAEKATSGPWTADHAAGNRDWGECFMLGAPDGRYITTVDPHMFYSLAQARADARFIAAARSDVPWLLDALAAREGEVRMLRERNAALEKVVEAGREAQRYSYVIEDPPLRMYTVSTLAWVDFMRALKTVSKPSDPATNRDVGFETGIVLDSEGNEAEIFGVR